MTITFTRRLAGLILGVLLCVPASAQTVKMACGSVPGIRSEAEWKPVPSQGINTLDLTFIGSKPTNAQLDKALRECAALGVKRDAGRDILVSGWFRKRPTDHFRDDELLKPYGSLKYLSYDARSKTVQVRELRLQKK